MSTFEKIQQQISIKFDASNPFATFDNSVWDSGLRFTNKVFSSSHSRVFILKVANRIQYKKSFSVVESRLWFIQV